MTGVDTGDVMSQQSVRQAAGDRVLDVGCGPGGSFPYLVHAVGQSGQVIGVEISPEISINAKDESLKRLEKRPGD
jgi:ubiquinone/menaquinone biosynthesis C-methylase UbiE